MGPRLAPARLHGVTSIVMGNCGVGFAPAHTDKHDWLIGLLEGVEDIPGTALAEGLHVGVGERSPSTSTRSTRGRYVVDVGAQVPHAALRTYVMGERGADHTVAASADDIAEMARLCEQGLRAGALGFTTSRTDVHRTRDGQSIGTLTAATASCSRRRAR